MGCGSHKPRTDYRQLDLVNVSGRVTLDGRPLAAAEIAAEAPNGSFSRGITDEHGRYRLWFDTRRTGVTKGPKVVRILATPRADDEADPGDPPAQRDALPACYNTASTLRIDVTHDSSSVDFNLHSVHTAEGSPAKGP
jgi:hypothetical protein